MSREVKTGRVVRVVVQFVVNWIRIGTAEDHRTRDLATTPRREIVGVSHLLSTLRWVASSLGSVLPT